MCVPNLMATVEELLKYGPKLWADSNIATATDTLSCVHSNLVKFQCLPSGPNNDAPQVCMCLGLACQLIIVVSFQNKIPSSQDVSETRRQNH